jgi:hypothetical protein
MTEEKDSSFKITDRRKFNPDGTPRDAEGESGASTGDEGRAAIAEEPAVAEASPGGGDASGGESPSGNVVSFESAKKKDRVEPPAPAAPPADEVPPAASAAREAANAAETAYKKTRGPQPAHVPEASFLEIADMLAVEAAINLGLMRTPEGNTPVDLEAARHLIDLLGVLQQKTRGNLTAEEDNMVENALAGLRMKFVELSGRR